MNLTGFQTRCPNQLCLHVFYPEGFVKHRGRCPSCRQAMTAVDLDVIAQTEKLYAKKLSEGTAFTEPFTDEIGEVSALLENVRSLWNVGSIFRTADGAGFSQLFLTGITGCPPRQEIKKVSLGAEETIPWRYHFNSLTLVQALKTRGVFALGLERCATSKPLNNFKRSPGQKICLIVGNEATGISEEVLSTCDEVCRLPMLGTKESLNVAVAFGIAAYRLIDEGRALS